LKGAPAHQIEPAAELADTQALFIGSRCMSKSDQLSLQLGRGLGLLPPLPRCHRNGTNTGDSIIAMVTILLADRRCAKVVSEQRGGSAERKSSGLQ